MRKFLLLIAVALFTTATYAQLWNSSISAVAATDAVDFNSPAAMDKDGNLYVTGTHTETFQFAGNDVETLGLGAYIAKYDVKGNELFAISLVGSIEITAITTDAENNFYVAGSYAGDVYITDVEGVAGEYQTISNTEEDSKTATFIAKYDASGNLLAVKSYQATLNAPIMDLYFGNPGKVSIEKIVAEGSKVYAYVNYNGDIALNETTTLVAKYVFAWESFYLDCASAALISYDANLENPSSLAELAIAEDGGDATFVNSFNFVVDGEDVYVAALAMGDIVFTTSAGSETFNFEYDGMGSTEKGAILAKIGGPVVKFSNISNDVYYGFDAINAFDLRNGNLYLVGTFAGSSAFDNNKVAVGASDVFVAAIDANELTAKWVYTNANNEGETNKYYEAVAGVVFAEDIYVMNSVVDMNNASAPVANNYAVSYAGEAKEAEAIAATAVAYNANNIAVINYAEATNIAMFGTEIATAIDAVAAEVENNVVYDLAGRRVENPTKGIYIVNGKKVIK